MQITFTIPDDKVSEFKNAFLQIYPIPMDEENNPTMDEGKWIKHCIRRMIFSVYEQGKEQLFRKQNKPVYDEDIVQEA